MATPGTFHSFIAWLASSSNPCSLAAGVAAEAGADATGFLRWAGATVLIAPMRKVDKRTFNSDFRIVFLPCVQAKSEFEPQADLPLASGQPFGNCAKSAST